MEHTRAVIIEQSENKVKVVQALISFWAVAKIKYNRLDIFSDPDQLAAEFSHIFVNLTKYYDCIFMLAFRVPIRRTNTQIKSYSTVDTTVIVAIIVTIVVVIVLSDITGEMTVYVSTTIKVKVFRYEFETKCNDHGSPTSCRPEWLYTYTDYNNKRH